MITRERHEFVTFIRPLSVQTNVDGDKASILVALMTLSSLSMEPRVEAMLEQSSIVSGPSTRMAEPARLEQLTDDLKTPQKASSLFFGPSVSFDTISDPRGGKAPKPLSSGCTSRNSKLLCLRLTSDTLKCRVPRSAIRPRDQTGLSLAIDHASQISTETIAGIGSTNVLIDRH